MKFEAALFAMRQGRTIRIPYFFQDDCRRNINKEKYCFFKMKEQYNDYTPGNKKLCIVAWQEGFEHGDGIGTGAPLACELFFHDQIMSDEWEIVE